MRIVGFIAAALAFGIGATVHAQAFRPSLQDSFQLGNARGALCQMQSRADDPALATMFDRGWAIVCRDAARSVGQVYALRGSENAADRLAARRDDGVTCASDESRKQIGELRDVAVRECRLATADVGYRIYRVRVGNVTYVAQGLAGYDSALQLGLRTIAADRPVDGAIDVATTGLSDPVAFARVQAGALDPAQTLAEGYRRNNAGNYAEAAEFFDTLQGRLDGEDASRDTASGRDQRMHEYLINQALQKSNLGDFDEADALFAKASQIATRDPVQMRLRRNFEAMNLLNQRRLDDAARLLARPVTPVASPPQGVEIEITASLASEINSAANAAQPLGITQAATLTPEERAAILDAQALSLSGTILRQQGDPVAAQLKLQRALADASAIREGRVTSIARLRAQILAEIALTLEDRRDYKGAETELRRAVELLRTSYPETTAMNGGKARLAAFLARRGRGDEAMALYREIVNGTAANRANTTGLANLLAPYFALLAERIPGDPRLVEDMFLASQTLVRPGVADTQAVLARELRGGDGEAARLFRQALTLSRDIERTRIEIARLNAQGAGDAAATAQLQARQAAMKAFVEQQSLTFSRLSEFPQYRALSTEAMTLKDLETALKPTEAYYKLAVVGRAIYAIYADRNGAAGWRLPISTAQLDQKVASLRATISTIENGQSVTYPFDVKLARALYLDLFAPVADRITATKHLIFEPDGAMLKLPPNLLIADQASADAYLARTAKPDADEFDFRGVAWLGRRTAVSTAVSARAFRDTRGTPASTARFRYIGFGDNAPVADDAVAASRTRGMTAGTGDDCNWPLTEWNKPIAATELRQAASLVGSTGTEVVTGGAFTDTAVSARPDLANYRIIHFATHGLVTAPRPECPARPALLTSFGGEESDGLLSFREIYDLKIDADLVILSACDTAGEASRAATREAGVSTGGGSALDGLVRAFIGAGGRSVIASHWPAPDDFHATQRLIGGLFERGGGQPVAVALQDAERALMDDAVTSHPYYWSGFAIVGDGAQPLLVGR